MKQITQPLPIFRIQVGELKARMVGGPPQAWVRLALMTDEGIPLADTSFTAWSEKSWDLLRKLCTSLEEDYEKTLRSTDHSQWGEQGQEEKHEGGIAFDDNNPWELNQ